MELQWVGWLAGHQPTRDIPCVLPAPRPRGAGHRIWALDEDRGATGSIDTPKDTTMTKSTTAGREGGPHLDDKVPQLRSDDRRRVLLLRPRRVAVRAVKCLEDALQ